MLISGPLDLLFPGTPSPQILTGFTPSLHSGPYANFSSSQRPSLTIHLIETGVPIFLSPFPVLFFFKAPVTYYYNIIFLSPHWTVSSMRGFLFYSPLCP